MNESKNNVSTMYHNIPAVAALNRVPGFEPVKLLRRTRSAKTNEEVLKLALPYKKLWFRLANPKGRIKLNALRVTEQLAIYEALVYLDRSDTEPISNFTASCTREDAPDGDYISAAQEEAMDEALSSAGFGLQFADVGMTKKAERYGSEIPLQVNAATVEAKKVASMPVVTKEQPAVEESLPVPEKVEEALPVPPTAQYQNVATSQEEEALPVKPEVSEAQKAAQILQMDSVMEKTEAEKAVMEAEELPVKESAPKYTPDMPVEEILKVMTFEDAEKVVVDTGTCNGWTIAEVAARRAPSLKFYLYGGYKGNNNILRAAAKIMLDHLEAQKVQKAG